MNENMEFEQINQRNRINELKEEHGMEEILREENGNVEEQGMPQEDMDELRLEDILAQTEYCIAQLENPQISLEDAFHYYEEGIRKLKACNKKVEQIEQKMLVINSHGQLEDF